MQIIDNRDIGILSGMLFDEPPATKQAAMSALLRGQQPSSFSPQPFPQAPPQQPQAAPQQGGASGSWDAPQQQPRLRQALAAQAQRPPVGPAAAPTIPPVPQAPPMDDFATRDADLQKQHDAATAEMNRYLQPGDPAAMNAYAKQRQEQGSNQLMLALAAQHAGDGYKGLQGHFLKQAADADEPVKMHGGTVTSAGWLEDPSYRQAMAVRQGEARIASIERAQAANISAVERRRLEQDKQQAAADLRQAQFALTASMANIASADRRYAADLAHEDRQAATAAKGPGKSKAADDAADGRAVLDLLTQAEKHLKGATGSYIGKGLDEAGRVIGYATPGAQATAALQTIGGQLVAHMPKMSGPQSDKDVLLYRQMAGQLDDPTIPYQSKKAALDQIRALNQKYALGGATGGWEPGASAAPAGGGLPAGWTVQTTK